MKTEMRRALPEVDTAGYWQTIGTAEQIEAFSAYLDRREPAWPPGPDRDAFVVARRSYWLRGADQ